MSETIRSLPGPDINEHKDPDGDLVIEISKWSMGPPHKPTKERTLLYYRDLDLYSNPSDKCL